MQDLESAPPLVPSNGDTLPSPKKKKGESISPKKKVATYSVCIKLQGYVYMYIINDILFIVYWRVDVCKRRYHKLFSVAFTILPLGGGVPLAAPPSQIVPQPNFI